MSLSFQKFMLEDNFTNNNSKITLGKNITVHVSPNIK